MEKLAEWYSIKDKQCEYSTNGKIDTVKRSLATFSLTDKAKTAYGEIFNTFEIDIIAKNEVNDFIGGKVLYQEQLIICFHIKFKGYTYTVFTNIFPQIS